MITAFNMSTDDAYPVHGTLEVRGTRSRLVIDRTFSSFTDATDVEHLARLLLSAAAEMRRNGSCPSCGGKGYALAATIRTACEQCHGQGVHHPEQHQDLTPAGN